MKNNIRITGGYLKGKNIPFDFKNSLRPTSSKLREVLFNWIQFEIKGMECLDLFAGTGALGIEALSRGAKKTIFIELNKKNYQTLKIAIKKLDLNEKSMVLFKDGLSLIKKSNLSNLDLILIDPPFNSDIETSVLDSLANNKTLMRSCKIYLEFSKFSSFQIPETFSVLKEKNVGDVRALFLKYDNKNSI